jgi:hypothetical protein
MSLQVELCEHLAQDCVQAAERTKDPQTRELLLRHAVQRMQDALAALSNRERRGVTFASSRTFDARYHSAVCRRARPTAVEPHGAARDRGAAVGGILGVCQPRSVRVSRASPSGCVSGNRARGAGRVRGTADQGGHGKAAGSPSRTCAGAACLIGLLRVGQKVPRKAVWRLFHAVVPAPPVGDTAGGTRNASSVFSPCTN